MTLFEVSAILITACALSSYINHKWLKLPETIGLMLIALITSLTSILLKKLEIIHIHSIETFLDHINFSETVFHGMLSLLLFAGALQINLDDLKNVKWPVAITASVSTIISTVLVGSVFYLLANYFGFTQISIIHGMLFGAIISPTDPIAVLAIIKKMGAPKSIETKIAGESLFNDGVAIVLFITILELLENTNSLNFVSTANYFLQQAGGGLLFGALVGWVAYHLIKKLDAHQPVLLVTLAVTTGGYGLAEKLHISAPLAMVVAGLIIGNQGRHKAMSKQTRVHIDIFWELIDEILNAILFFMIGLEMLVINANHQIILLAISCIAIVLMIRLISVAIPIYLMRPFYKFMNGTSIIMTWGGLRGALSIAMVLSLSHQYDTIKDIFLPCIYSVVIFSIVVQGLTFRKLLYTYSNKTPLK